MSRMSRDKGRRIELEIVHLHHGIDVPCRRRQAAGIADGPDDPDLLVAGCLDAEVKARASGSGFKTLERWLAKHDLLFLRRDRKQPLVVMPWEVYAAILPHWYESGACTTWAPECDAAAGEPREEADDATPNDRA